MYLSYKAAESLQCTKGVYSI